MTRIALYQARSGIDPVANAERLVDAIKLARGQGAQMLFTPEMTGLLDRDRGRAGQSIRTEEEDVTLDAARKAAAKEGLWLQLGSLALDRGDGRWVNRSFVIDPAGHIVARYDKMHLFDVDLETGERWRESAVYEAGDSPVLAEKTAVGALGMTICYDLRFAALFARLAEAGAQCISVPAAFTVPTGKAHWEVLLRARAIENGLFIVAAAQVGEHEDGRETYGHSMVCDPWGNVLLDMGDKAGVGCCDLDPALIDRARAAIPALRHRRDIPAIDD
ncbi:carbon-nitrogen hydrolase family protein [Sphingomicrobium arenosum]|uniref:carbon-nitrogen hydrolase family protein n=1 Tax=Sphingomicrobium arenosum TaxID=2233861 RepID=UPI002240B8C4|nr:carbon-nitrogen hydrolase family protein [Sphingomicrobium arenosum]